MQTVEKIETKKSQSENQGAMWQCMQRVSDGELSVQAQPEELSRNDAVDGCIV